MVYQQPLAAQADLVQQLPNVLNPPLRAPASLKVVAVVAGTREDAHRVCSRLERFQEMLWLQPASARERNLVHRDGPLGFGL